MPETRFRRRHQGRARHRRHRRAHRRRGRARRPHRRGRRGPSGDRTLDAGGCFVAPGLVDLHTHLREPGKEEAETVETGARGAALGGFTAIVAMPNTTPAIDSAGVVREVLELGGKALCDVTRPAAITVDRAGDQLAPMAEMAAARRAHVHRRRRRRAGQPPDAPGHGVRHRARRHARPALRGRRPLRRRPHARGRVVEPASASPASPTRPRSSW